MKRTIQRMLAACAAASLVLTGLASSAAAQSGPTLAIQLFDPAAGDGEDNYLEGGGAQVLDHLEPAFGIITNYAYNPLVLEDVGTGDEVALVEHQLKADVQASLGLWDRLQIAFDVPVTLYQDEGSSGTLPARDLQTTVAGDMRFVPKVRLFGDREGPALAMSSGITFPTGDASEYHGIDGGVGVEPRLTFEYRAGDVFRSALAVGYMIRTEQQTYQNVDVGNEVTYNLGFAVAPAPDDVDLELLAELHGTVAADPDSDLDVENAPLEVNTGVRWNFVEGQSLMAGVGRGLTRGYGSPDVRAFVGYTVAPSGGSEDMDHDGINDSEDMCPSDPEDRDGFEDGDGCPDLDNDRDGIVDIRDDCPNRAEDMDNLADHDGCPEADADHDGILDTEDECPARAEDPDADADADGCPEVKDAVIVKEPEACVINEGVLEEKVYFDFNEATLKPRGSKVLDRVAGYLKAHPEIALIRVGGHADYIGTKGYNEKLGARRAQTVIDYLVSQGVDRSRLTTESFGEKDPAVEPADDPGDRQINRRVEFQIIEVQVQ